MADRFYELEVAGCKRALPILNVTDKLAIAGFIMLGDAELTLACARGPGQKDPG
jgi:adenine phosphoribosyltransferase